MSFSDELLAWYDQNARELPWRGQTDPYRVWLSEIMLQQTQTETVKGYYARFLDRFPTVSALAAAPEEEVLKLWEGLGYYSRARNLHAAARQVAGELDGRFPMSAEALRRLPGVGPYAANAIASIAYGEPVPALDGNQARVLSRVLAWESELRTPFDLLEPALELISRERPGDYNQALMDLGAMICTPRQPDCASCPVAGHCRAFAEDAAQDFPRKPAPVPKREEAWTILLIRLQGRLLVRRRPKGLLGGLYEFVALEGHPSSDALTARLAGLGVAEPRLIRPLPDAKHVFTHKVWRMRGWLAQCDAAPEGFIPVDAAGLDALPFPSALRVYREIAEDLLRD
ncbi:MAG: A/G-specific adenine glycosylase [Clostridia bacterium]|nr:A/G-specific adenine glycosylase [Clostridia bacterium]